jgi:hypothetical protein
MIKATPQDATRHLFGQLPRSASQRERERRESLIETFAIMRRHELGKVQPKRVVDNAYRRWRYAFRREHGETWERGLIAPRGE